MTGVSDVAAARRALIAAGFKPVTYAPMTGEILTPGFILEATTEPGVLYLAQDRLTSGALKRGGAAKVKRTLARYAQALEAAGWLTDMKARHLLVTRSELHS